MISNRRNIMTTSASSTLLDMYFKLQDDIHAYFGYEEDWVVLPLDDGREYFWNLDEERGVVQFAKTPTDLIAGVGGEYYENSIYTQRCLPKFVYRTDEFTMICVDTNTDGNKFLQIFDNKKDMSSTVETHETLNEFCANAIAEQKKTITIIVPAK